MPLKDITGRIVVKPENIEFASLAATPADSNQLDSQPRIRLDGKMNITGQDINTAELKLNATEMCFDEKLTPLLGKMGKYYTKLEPTGRFDLNFDKIKFDKNEKGQKALRFDGNIMFKNCSVGKNKPVSNIYALLNIDAQYTIGAGLQNCQLFLDVQNVLVKDRPLKNLIVPLTVDINEQKIIVQNFVGDFLGGRIAGAAAFHTDSEGKLTTYKIDMALAGVDSESFVSPKTSVSPQPVGFLNGELNIQGDFQQPEITRGRLTAEATGLKPWERGVVAQIRSAILEVIKKDLAFDNVKIQAVIKGKTVYISRFDLYGLTASLRGTGTYEPASDLVNINFVGYGGAGKENPNFIDSITAGWGAAFLKVEVTGKLEEPQIKVIPLPIFQKSLEIIGTK
jgi:hypothetical protein